MKENCLRLDRLPDITFVGADDDTTLYLRQSGPQIAARAALLRAQLATGLPVGLVFRTGPALVLNWLACVVAGVEPLILQYPTEKLTRAYWQASIGDSLRRLGIGTVLMDDELAERGIALPCKVILGSALAAAGHEEQGMDAIGRFAILQLSSGTTGHRKPIRFHSEDLHRHVGAYNKILALDPLRDVIVSWLPLYHDMGYIACFIMPLILGVPVVMLDPMDWTRRPRSLFDAIRRHSGTTCFMPNFGFEVMSRFANGDRFPTMRRWISCSEPVSSSTMEKFLAATGAAPESLHACYGMAENIFAVSQATGIATRRIDGRDVVSCGRPIPGCKVRAVDGELRVKSPSALKSYVGGGAIRDWRGYYSTGDLGAVIDGEVYIVGRKAEILIQAGRKFDLANLDKGANNIFTEAPGRIATIAHYDRATGTEKPVFLIESPSFYCRDDAATAAATLRKYHGLEMLDVEFVPPRFITKTSSGKINRRKTAEDWHAVREGRQAAMHGSFSLEADLRKDFGGFDWNKPVKDVLDSLALVVVQLILGAHNAPYDRDRTIAELAMHEPPTSGSGPATDEGLLVVILGEALNYRQITAEDLKPLAAAMGCPIRIEHVCAPPSPVLLSDLIFHDYFMPRVWSEAYRHFAATIGKIKRASVLIVDDTSEIGFPIRQVYAPLSHRLERDPAADLIGVRWQRYSEGHAELPCVVVAGPDLPPSNREASLSALGRYLGVPIFKIARIRHFEPFTRTWDLIDRRLTTTEAVVPLDPWSFVQQFGNWLGAHKDRIRLRSGVAGTAISTVGLPHYCSWFLSQSALDVIIEKYDRFCLVGSPASVPYVERRLRELRKPFHRVPVYSRALVQSMPPHDCVLVLGPMGLIDTDKPVLAPMQLNAEVTSQNVVDLDLQTQIYSEVLPTSSTDGLFGVTFDRSEAQQLLNFELAQNLQRESEKTGQAMSVPEALPGPTMNDAASQVKRPDPLPWVDWNQCSGLWGPEGPFPELGLRSRFRWISSLSCLLVIESAQAQCSAVHIHYWNQLPGQHVQATFNGCNLVAAELPVKRHAVDASPAVLTLPADLVAGRNELRLDFSKSAAAPNNLRKLVIIVEQVAITAVVEDATRTTDT